MYPRQLVQFSELIGNIYDCVPDTALWEGFLRTCSAIFDVKGAQIIYSNLETQSFLFNAVYGFPNDELDRFQKYAFQDPLMPHVEKYPNKVWSDKRIDGGHEQFNELPLYSEFLKPLGVNERIGFSTIENGNLLSFALLSGPEREIFNDEELNMLSELQPHVLRAVSLQQALLKSRYENKLLQEFLNGFPVGIVLVDKDARIHYQNDTAKNILSSDRSIYSRHELIRCKRENDNDALGSAIRNGASIGLPKDVDIPNTVRIDDTDGYLMVSIGRFGGQFAKFIDLDENLPVAVVYICDSKFKLETTDQLLSRLFGLTPAEAKTLNFLAQGCTIREIANATELSVETVRTYVKQILGKTNCSRQSELIQLVNNSPAWLNYQSS